MNRTQNLLFIQILLMISSTYAQNKFLMPHEGVLHKRTWMGFPNDPQIWRRSLKGVQQDIVYLAKTISKYEPVNLIVDSENTRKFVESLLSNVNIVSQFDLTLVVQPINDLWLRDTGATFVLDTLNKKVKAVDFNFNGWGNKQKHNKDEKIAKFITQYNQIELISTDLVLEGGGLEVDGEGTAILAQSCILNKNRNPGWTKSQVEEELAYLLGITKFIWVPGVRNAEITDGHIDFYARFVGESKPGYVLVHMDSEDPSTLQNYQIINSSTDAKGRKLKAIPLQIPNPDKIRNTLIKGDDSAIGYCNFYLANNAVILANFGDTEADESARQVLQNMFPERVIEMISIDNIVNGGGSVHCSTQQDILY
ncbi:porphyromonas-type peptidyl-arginine deiminase (macronuclear) [Tetrahymena thermophila SB210]|uniref:Porphyromonas-type peptidyl-arginine deiminase n=1 Tax=Tetrahymena thermophila (strain SB210) TaxID=312017 RepID=Q23BZ3_TETTS|nr:porphyromonas-type peptidyl-arginine deiminase [Tetrahymena thermophila SB210]EAR93975.2 porphyromonas-type peptidyl-arginine deiminase [Tetrahymena thermophila SB210]|eukprot:XP_001014220.2 porphyromonas-type peptidyl-arginine deiminase [Tetrahymena thermophila SB210]